jgi:hypothetical protein
MYTRIDNNYFDNKKLYFCLKCSSVRRSKRRAHKLANCKLIYTRVVAKGNGREGGFQDGGYFFHIVTGKLR